jgi:hypothetical protein
MENKMSPFIFVVIGLNKPVNSLLAKPSCSSSMTESLNLTVPFIKILPLHSITYEQRQRRQEDDQLKAMRRR